MYFSIITVMTGDNHMHLYLGVCLPGLANRERTRFKIQGSMARSPYSLTGVISPLLLILDNESDDHLLCLTADIKHVG